MKEAVFGGACLIAGAIIMHGGAAYFGLVLGVFGLLLGLNGVFGGKTKDN